MVNSGRRRSWFSRGKLMLTGEYVVLKGAAALALPVKFGQGLEWWGDRSSRKLEWDTFVKGEKWFSAVFTVSANGYEVESSSDAGRAGFIVKILNAAARLTHDPLPAGRAESSVGFDMGWGLGSSSTLISNIAWLFDVNPFALHFSVSRGSGYDIACARSDMPLVYRLENSRSMPVYRHVAFDPPFSGDLYFAYTGRKQDSAGSVDGFLSGAGKKKSVPDKVLNRISEITTAVTEVTDTDSFAGLLKEHDSLIRPYTGAEHPAGGGFGGTEHLAGGILAGAEHPARDIFAGFPGYVKPLGAWGGDFVMLTWKDGYRELKKLLEQKGIDVVFPWDKIIYTAGEKK
ncbi:MAG: hypothetical protein EA408_12815 [Marinilabiliales bacterium]|nr:MAG: hypothetical protein EA408_12815 [Marinilabiliales bacterium]